MNMYVDLNHPEEAISMFEFFLQSFRNTCKGNKAVLTIKEDRLTRSQKQNKLYWVWIRILADHIGIHNEEEASDVISEHLIGVKRYVNLEGEEKTKPISTSKLKVDEMSHYLEKVNIFAGTLGVKLPQPKEKL